MASSRIFLLVILVGFSLVFLIYFYPHNYLNIFNSTPIEITLSNGTKIISTKSIYWYDKIKEKFRAATSFAFIQAFIESISVIVVSELGDKTFFIAAILAMRHSRLIIYSGAMSALGAMTILSALLGNIATSFIPRVYTYYLSCILFGFFGIKMLKEAYYMSPTEGAVEYEEVQHEVEVAEATNEYELGDNTATKTNATTANEEPAKLEKKHSFLPIISILRRCFSPIYLETFIMTFLAEWGDRSQISTIVLAASENLLGVIIGGTVGHALCTGLAVIGGRFIAQRISLKTVTLIGSFVFLASALSVVLIRPDD